MHVGEWRRLPAAGALMASSVDEDNLVRCWICLDDESLDDPNAGMIAPCACVGTNQWVHEACACCAALHPTNFPFFGCAVLRSRR